MVDKYHKTATTLIKGAKTLDRKYYIDKDIFDLELENIFYKNWLCIGRSNEVSKKGKFIKFDLGSESIIIVRNDKNVLNGFFNVCRHRGTRICIEEKGSFSNTIQCKYHGWTYNLEGRLVGAPNMDNVDKFEKKDYPLHTVLIKEWEGFIFICLSDKAEEFDTFYEPIKNKFNEWQLSELETIEKKDYLVKANWKLVMQNYNECYHCPTIHPDLAKIHHFTSGENDLYEGPFLGGFMTLNENMNSITKSGDLSSNPIPAVKKINLNRVYYYSLFPNMLISLHPDYVMYHRVLPISTNQCKVTCSWLFLQKNNDQHNKRDAIEFWDKTNKQDWNISKLSQLGIQSRKYSPGPYSGRESLLSTFDNYYLSKLNT